MTDTVKRVSLLDYIDEAMTEPTSTHAVYLDGAAWAEAKQLRTRIGEERKATGGDLASKVPALEAELDQVLAALTESELVFTFRQLPRTEKSELEAAHQAGKTEDMPWNADTYPPALVQAACIGVTGKYEAPGITTEEVAGLWERLGQAQTDGLFGAAFTLQLEEPKPFIHASTGQTAGLKPS